MSHYIVLITLGNAGFGQGDRHFAVRTQKWNSPFLIFLVCSLTFRLRNLLCHAGDYTPSYQFSGKNLNFDHLLDEAVGVAPLIVIPADYFNEIAADDLGES